MAKEALVQQVEGVHFCWASVRQGEGSWTRRDGEGHSVKGQGVGRQAVVVGLHPKMMRLKGKGKAAVRVWSDGAWRSAAEAWAGPWPLTGHTE